MRFACAGVGLSGPQPRHHADEICLGIGDGRAVDPLPPQPGPTPTPPRPMSGSDTAWQKALIGPLPTPVTSQCLPKARTRAFTLVIPLSSEDEKEVKAKVASESAAIA